MRSKIWSRTAGFWETAYFHVVPPRVPWSTAAGPFLGPPGYPWGPLDMFWHMYLGGLEHMRAYRSHNRRSMPPPKKALSPASRAKADKRNEREKTKRAAKAAASGGTTSGKKRKATPDLAEEEMTSSGGSWERSGELLFAL